MYAYAELLEHEVCVLYVSTPLPVQHKLGLYVVDYHAVFVFAVFIALLVGVCRSFFLYFSYNFILSVVKVHTIMYAIAFVVTARI